MQDQYSRTQLLLGKEAMEKLHNSRVAVFGIGGVGGYTVEALARSPFHRPPYCLRQQGPTPADDLLRKLPAVLLIQLFSMKGS